VRLLANGNVDDPDQVASLLGGEAGHGPIIDELGEQPGGLAIDGGKGDLVEKPGEPLVENREPVPLGCRGRRRRNFCPYRPGPG
jgi:hypothetical protein